MIGPGWLPRYRPRASAVRRPTRPYTRRPRSRPRAKHPARAGAVLDDPIVWFDPGRAEFPIASMRPREVRGRVIALAGAMQRWLYARWQWLRPRTVPCAVAALGMLAVLAAADYLAHHEADHARIARPAVHVDLAAR